MSPPSVRITTASASPENRTRSGVMSSTWVRFAIDRSATLDGLGLHHHVVDPADVQERLLGDIVEVASDEGFEAPHRLVDRDVDPGQAREDLRHEQGLRQEALDLPGARHAQAVLLGELVEAEDGDDVLELAS